MSFLTTVTFILVIIYAVKGQFPSRSPQTGWSTLFYTANTTEYLTNPTQVLESIDYQSSTGLIASGNVGGSPNTAWTFPFSSGAVQQVWYNVSVQGYYNALAAFQYPTGGTLVDPTDNSIIWFAYGQYYGDTKTCGVYKYIPGSTYQDYSFEQFANSYGCSGDDLAIDESSNMLYLTDFWGYQVFSLNTVTGAMAVLNNDTTLLCGSTPQSGATNGPNGIVLWTTDDSSTQIKYALVIVSPSKLVKINLATGVGVEVTNGINTPANALYYMDGAALVSSYGRDSVLYIASSVLPLGSVMALTSINSWTNYELRNVYGANCTNTSTTAVRTADDDAVILCNNNFVAGAGSLSVMYNIGADRPRTNGPIAYVSESISSNFVPENFDYDPNRNMLVFGSYTDGGVRGYPYNSIANGDTIYYNDANLHTYVTPGESNLYSSYGVQVNPQNSLGSNCLALVCGGSTSSGLGAASLYLIDLCLDTIVKVVTFNADGDANDVIVMNGIAYVTDSTLSAVYSVEIYYTDGVATSFASNTNTILTDTSAASNDPAFFCSVPDGIEAYPSGNYLLISMFNTGLGKYDVNSKSFTKVLDPTQLLYGFDGMQFNKDNSILYGVRNSFTQVNSGGPDYQTVFAMISCNNWENASLAYSFQLNCNNSNGAGVQMVTNSNGNQDMIVMCTDNFGDGPYPINRVDNVDKVVTNLANPCGTVSTSSSSSSDNNISQGAAVGAFIGVGVAVMIFYALVMKCSKSTNLPN